MKTDETVFVVDDDAAVRDSVSALLESASFRVENFDSAASFLASRATERPGCLVVDIRMPDMDGLELQEEMVRRQIALPVIVMTGHADVPLAVRAMKAGAVDFIEKPFNDELLLDSVARALEAGRQQRDDAGFAKAAKHRVAGLTQREREVLEHLVAGKANKMIAYDLDISPRTVEVHRANLMEKMQARTLSDLVRMALEAGVRLAGNARQAGPR
ncbi:response regulator receiver protein [Parvibaculum lavamentivorans DS-1]|uniref:Response regulator receiver protein n=1 Tax=Parvibaculum lavamentivorans (strain DS-1 / DSM 13023 / NCIMB 13966) TaxID=402881 RepID=A7HUS2_PARL1|nr:response regulator FixJ [Parvibaculum lavamentivorans]ABS63655.1 response regulator receiver protein [Parvibaculum lavamentivorans DS-1]